MRIAICEDNHEHAEILQAMIQRWAVANGVKVDIGRYTTAEEFIYYWPADAQYDLAFLDIQMASMTGMQLARCIRKQDQAMLLVFTTGIKDYILKGYEVKAFRYLVKPIKERDIEATLTKAFVEIDAMKSEAVVIPVSSATQRIFKRDIFYVEINNHYIVMHTAGGNYRFKGKLSSVESWLPEPNFCKCHRSYIVNLHHTGKVTKTEVEIDNGDTLRVSRDRWAALNECFISYYTQR